MDVNTRSWWEDFRKIWWGDSSAWFGGIAVKPMVTYLFIGISLLLLLLSLNQQDLFFEEALLRWFTVSLLIFWAVFVGFISFVTANIKLHHKQKILVEASKLLLHFSENDLVTPNLEIRELPSEILDEEKKEYAGILVFNHSNYDIDDFCGMITEFKALESGFDPINADSINPNGDFVSIGAGSDSGQVRLKALIGKVRFNIAKAVNEKIVIQNQKTPYPLNGWSYGGKITFTGKTPSGMMKPISRSFFIAWGEEGQIWDRDRIKIMVFGLSKDQDSYEKNKKPEKK